MKVTNPKFIIALFTFVMMILFSTDSFIYERYGCSDSECFFMSGKALMNGLKPYVDFSDSKGLLLWVIYGIGYLISPTSFIGVWFISLCAVVAAFFFLYKIAFLYLHDNVKSLIALFLTSLALFNPWFHNETRAETFCWPFTTMAVYYTLSIIKRANIEKKYVSKAGCILGLSVGACLMIKFTIAAMVMICPIILAYFAYKYRLALTLLFAFLIGFCAAVFPCVLYLMLIGSLDAFVHEYFFVTTATSVESSFFTNLLVYLIDWKCMIQNVRDSGSCLCVVYLIGSFVLCKYNKKDGQKLRSHIPFIIAFWFLSIAVFHSWWIYYLESFTVFGVFLFIYLIQRSSQFWFRRHSVSFCAVSVVVLLSLVWRCDNGTYYVWQKEKLKDYRKIESLLTQISEPRVVNYCIETGLGRASISLPACKYWTWQLNSTQEMADDRLRAISTGTADIIIARKKDNIPFDQPLDNTLNDMGYFEYLPENNTGYRLFVRSGLLSSQI